MNRIAFERYSRLMKQTLWVVPLAWVLASILLLVALDAFTVNGDVINRLHVAITIGLLVGAALFMGYCEVQKTLIWRQDLRG